MKDLTTIMPAYVFMSMLLKVIVLHSGESSNGERRRKKRGKKEAERGRDKMRCSVPVSVETHIDLERRQFK